MILVDARGERCPIPVIKTKKALEELHGAGELQVLVDNEAASENVRKLAEGSGASCTIEKESATEYRIKINVSKTGSLEPGQVPECCPCSSEKVSDGMLVIISSDRMGEGDDTLGRLLMRSFLYTVTQLDPLPGTVLFYNGGARLTVTGSECLEDIRYLESQGVEILTCGTCLNHLGLTEQLEVGAITNMYTIAEKMAGADKVIHP